MAPARASSILNPCIKEAENLIIYKLEYLNLFKIEQACTVQDVWKQLYYLVKPNIQDSHHAAIEIILEHGTLATRILKAIDKDFSKENIKNTYSKLGRCLQENQLFIP